MLFDNNIHLFLMESEEPKSKEKKEKKEKKKSKKEKKDKKEKKEKEPKDPSEAKYLNMEEISKVYEETDKIIEKLLSDKS